MEEKTQSALFTENPPSGKFKMVKLSEIALNFPLPPVPDGFVESIRMHGVLEPILLRFVPESETPNSIYSNLYQIVAGRRRYAAAFKLEMASIPAIVFEVGASVASIQTLVENAQRERNPVSEYKAVRSLVSEGYTLEQISEAVGKTKGEIEQLLKLAILPESVMTGVEQGNISLGTAKKLTGMPAAYVEKAAEIHSEAGKLTMQDLKAMRDTGKKAMTLTLPAQAFEKVEPEGRYESAVAEAVVYDETSPCTLQDLLIICPKWLLERMLGTVRKAGNVDLEKSILNQIEVAK